MVHPVHAVPSAYRVRGYSSEVDRAGTEQAPLPLHKMLDADCSPSREDYRGSAREKHDVRKRAGKGSWDGCEGRLHVQSMLRDMIML